MIRGCFKTQPAVVCRFWSVGYCLLWLNRPEPAGNRRLSFEDVRNLGVKNIQKKSRMKLIFLTMSIIHGNAHIVHSMDLSHHDVSLSKIWLPIKRNIIQFQLWNKVGDESKMAFQRLNFEIMCIKYTRVKIKPFLEEFLCN